MTTTTGVPTGTSFRVHRSSRTSLLGGVVMLALVGVMGAVVPFTFSLGTLIDLVGLFTLVILGTSWNLMAGYGGLISIGQQGFIGAGGYACVYLGDKAGIPPMLAILSAGVVCALLAYPTSFLLFRLVGGYFAIGSWVVAEVFHLVTSQIPGLGGGAGLSMTAFQGVDRTTRIAQIYWISLILAVAVVIATWLLVRSRWGLGLTALRDDAVAAAGLGVAVRSSQRVVYIAASAGAGLAGALIATNGLGVTPASIYSVNYTAFMIFIVVIGGTGSVEGPILGAVIFYVLQQQLQDYGVWYLIVLGVIAVIAVLTAPRGLWGLISRNGRFELFPVGHRISTDKGK